MLVSVFCFVWWRKVYPTFLWAEEDLELLEGSPVIAATVSMRNKLESEYATVEKDLLDKFPKVLWLFGGGGAVVVVVVVGVVVVVVVVVVVGVVVIVVVVAVAVVVMVVGVVVVIVVVSFLKCSR